MNTNFKIINSLLVICFILIECRTVQRIKKHEDVKDISGDWNDRDYRTTSKELSEKLIYESWRTRFINKNNRLPKIMVGSIRNRTSEHNITKVMGILVANLERELLKTGEVIISGNKALRDEVAQTGLTPEMRAALSQGENGSDFILTGEITSLEDVYNKKEVRTYMISLSLIELTTGNKVLILSKDDIIKYIRG